MISDEEIQSSGSREIDSHISTLPAILEHWMSESITKKFLPIIRNEILHSLKIFEQEKIKPQIQKVLEEGNYFSGAQKHAQMHEEHEDKNQEDTSSLKDQLQILKLSHNKLVQRVELLEKQKSQATGFRDGQIQFNWKQQETIKNLQKNLASLKENVSGFMKIDFDKWSELGKPSKLTYQLLRFGLNQKPFENRDLQLIDSKLLFTQKIVRIVRWEHSIVEKNSFSLQIQEISDISHASVPLAIGICDRNCSDQDLEKLVLMQGNYSSTCYDLMQGNCLPTRYDKSEKILPPNLRSICYRFDSKIIESGRQVRTSDPSFKAKDVLDVIVDWREGRITYNVNGQLQAFYQSVKIQERPEDWVPFIQVSGCTAIVKLLTTYF